MAASLFGDSKTEQNLRADLSGQALQLAAQAQSIRSLQAQLAAARIQIATANGKAAGSVAALESRRDADSKTFSDSTNAASQLTAVLVQLSKEQAKRSIGHAETMDKIDRQTATTTHLVKIISNLLVIMFLVLLAQIPIITSLVVKGRRKAWQTPNPTTTSS